MKLVSTAKLRRTEELARRSKVYADRLTDVLEKITANIQQYKIGGVDTRLFCKPTKLERMDIIFVTADKGLCGGFNTQTIKKVRELLKDAKEQNIKVRLRGVGKKGVDYFKYNDIELLQEVTDLSSKPDYEKAAGFIRSAIDDFIDEKTDKVVIVHNGYKNIITQEIRVSDVLPIDVAAYTKGQETTASLLEMEAYDEEEMLDSLLQKYVEFTMYFSLIDSLAAEHSARMQAMDAATNNASEMVKKLNVEFNKARQAAITTELIEIISGVESMK
jgi:F-type H+-transporting ATPase subunit gamma